MFYLIIVIEFFGHFISFKIDLIILFSLFKISIMLTQFKVIDKAHFVNIEHSSAFKNYLIITASSLIKKHGDDLYRKAIIRNAVKLIDKKIF